MSILDSLIGLLCHQIPERSPHFAGQTFPLCYRCAGLYFGMASTYFWLGVRGDWRRRLPSNPMAVFLGFAMLPLLIDGWGNFLGWWTTAGPLRTLTGLSAGLVLPLFLLPLIQLLDKPNHLIAEASRTPNISFAFWPAALGVAATWLLIHPGSPLVFRSLALIAGIALTTFLINFALAAQPWVRNLLRWNEVDR